MRKRAIAGFTLIEQLAVLVIIGLLAAIVLASFLSQANKAHYAQVNSDLYHIAFTIREYRLEQGHYPPDQNPNVPPIAGKFFPTQPNTPFDGRSAYDFDHFEFNECIIKVSNTGKNGWREDDFSKAGRLGEIEVTGDDRALTIDRGNCGES